MHLNSSFSFAGRLLRPGWWLSLLSMVSGCGGAQAAETPATDQTLSPYFWVKPASTGTDGPAANEPDPLPLKSTRVEATVAGVFAEVTVTQHYANTGHVALEASYIFPGSTRAAVHGLTLRVGDRTIVAQVKEKAAAAQIYETAKKAGQTASLLEEHRPNVFQMKVANILPGDDISVELHYTETLVPTAGVYEFVYPGVVGPRYSNRPSAGASPDQTWVANPYLAKGTTDPAAFSLSVHLVAPMAIQDVQCRSHATNVQYRAANDVSIDEKDTASGNRDFILDYRLTGGAIQAGLAVAQGEENFFLLTVQPPARIQPAEIPPREYDFIVDVSGSMAGFPLKTAKALIHGLLVQLRPQDSFDLLLFSGGSQVLAEQPVPATEANVQAALKLIDDTEAAGGTELLPALQRAFAFPHRENTSRSVIVVTDGYVDVEAEAFQLVRDQLGQANLFAFGVGSSVNRHLMEGLARTGQGEAFIVTDQDSAGDAVKRFVNYVSSPLLTHVGISFPGFDAYSFEPAAVPDLLADRPLIVYGKWRGALNGKIVVTGQTGQGAFRADYNVAEATRLPDAEGLARLWARARIATLGDFQELKPTDEGKAQITQLGLSYNLLTKFTSFVAVDNVVRRTGPDLKTIQQPLALPAGVENSAVGNSVSASPEPDTYALAGVCLTVAAIAWRVRRRCQYKRRVRNTES